MKLAQFKHKNNYSQPKISLKKAKTQSNDILNRNIQSFNNIYVNPNIFVNTVTNKNNRKQCQYRINQSKSPQIIKSNIANQNKRGFSPSQNNLKIKSIQLINHFQTVPNINFNKFVYSPCKNPILTQSIARSLDNSINISPHKFYLQTCQNLKEIHFKQKKIDKKQKMSPYQQTQNTGNSFTFDRITQKNKKQQYNNIKLKNKEQYEQNSQSYKYWKKKAIQYQQANYTLLKTIQYYKQQLNSYIQQNNMLKYKISYPQLMSKTIQQSKLIQQLKQKQKIYQMLLFRYKQLQNIIIRRDQLIKTQKQTIDKQCKKISNLQMQRNQNTVLKELIQILNNKCYKLQEQKEKKYQNTLNKITQSKKTAKNDQLNYSQNSNIINFYHNQQKLQKPFKSIQQKKTNLQLPNVTQKNKKVIQITTKLHQQHSIIKLLK